MSLRLAHRSWLANHPLHLPRRPDRDVVEVAVIGCGDWTRRSIRPQLVGLRDRLVKRGGKPSLHVTYLDRWARPPDWLMLHSAWEAYASVDDIGLRLRLETEPIDVAIIATPDQAHVDCVRFWSGLSCDSRPRARLLLVEKPLSDCLDEANRLVSDLAASSGVNDPRCHSPIAPVDHYLWRASRYMSEANLGEWDERLGEIERIEFCMLEIASIDPSRFRTLRSGVFFDMAVHGLGLVAMFVDLASSHSVDVGVFGRRLSEDVRPGRYLAETAIEASLRARLRESDSAVEIYLRVAKGEPQSDKSLRFVGRSGSAVELSLRRPMGTGPDSRYEQMYADLVDGFAVEHDEPVRLASLTMADAVAAVSIAEQVRESTAGVPRTTDETMWRWDLAGVDEPRRRWEAGDAG